MFYFPRLKLKFKLTMRENMMKTIKATFLGLIGMAFALSAYADITFVSWGGAYTAS